MKRYLKMSVILLCPATRVYSMLEDGWQGNFRRHQIGKETCAIFDDIGHQRTALPRLYMDMGGEAN